MNCMKCGRETVKDDVFCAQCLAEMESYPVRPGTVVQLPQRREEPVVKKSSGRRKAAPAPEEQVKRLKKAIRKLWVTILVLVLLLAAAGHFAGKYILEATAEFLPGQNYHSVTETLPEE